MTKEVDTGEEKVYTEAEHKGLIKDTQSERTKRQDAEFNLDSSRREIESLKKTIADSKAKADEKIELTSDKLQFEGKDEDYATVKDVKLGFKSLEQNATATFKKAQKVAKDLAEQARLKDRFDESCQKQIEKYIKLQPIGLDFETVYKTAIRRIGRNRHEELAILHDKNPGARLYKMGCEDPDIKAKLDLEENQELLKSMENRKVDKSSLTGGVKVKSDEFFTPQEIINMTPLEAKDNLPKIEKSMKHWEELKKKK